ncbi:MAG: hypothetical protein GYA24_20195 [Candidatus Lokiarchaeota archaeon]|nr:hypothetical protein [Candidatus Lokiarchaeota archaeon]
MNSHQQLYAGTILVPARPTTPTCIAPGTTSIVLGVITWGMLVFKPRVKTR